MRKFRTCLTAVLVGLPFLIGSIAHAQSISPFFGLGSARDSAGTSANPGCNTGQLFDAFTGICENGPTMGGLFALFGADVLFSQHLGVEAEYTFHMRRVDFLPNAGLRMRPEFLDLNVLWQPLKTERLRPALEAGAGTARIGLSFNSSGCVITPCTQAQSTPTHFQFHLGAGMKLYIHGNLFVKPQFDFRYVHNLDQQFGRTTVLEYSGSVGYTFGHH